tara:strand:- start:631 stop:1134 length:504 start_codon:yes stop_codon:yes gene_type:complete
MLMIGYGFKLLFKVGTVTLVQLLMHVIQVMVIVEYGLVEIYMGTGRPITIIVMVQEQVIEVRHIVFMKIQRMFSAMKVVLPQNAVPCRGRHVQTGLIVVLTVRIISTILLLLPTTFSAEVRYALTLSAVLPVLRITMSPGMNVSSVKQDTRIYIGTIFSMATPRAHL